MKDTGKKQGGVAPCAACKLLRRRCARDCIFAPYFPAEEPHKFASVHKVFGASNVNKMLQDLPDYQRGDAAISMVYEANARVKDPVYGCVRAIASLQHQINVLQAQLALAKAELTHIHMHHFSSVYKSAESEFPSFKDTQLPHVKFPFSMDVVEHHHQPMMETPLWQ